MIPASDIIDLKTALDSLVAAGWVEEAPGGTVDGSNVTFTLSSTPAPNSDRFFVNGLRQVKGVDYTISGDTITAAAAPLASDTVWAEYWRQP